MLSTFIVKQLIDSATGNFYKVGDRVRVLLKSKSEYIGTIKNIFGDSFVLLVEDEDKTILIETVEKMRFAKPGENFLNHFEF
jgi:hypothetical protein